MEIATSQSLSRIWRLALVGAATAFAWVVLSLLLGLGSGNAHAADGDDDRGGLLGAVTSVVDRTASTVTDTVTDTLSTVADTTTAVVDTVVDVAPAPVKQPVKQVVTQVVSTVDTVVTTTTKPVTDVVSGGVVGAVTEPIVEVITQVPVVGDVVSGVGLDDAITDLGGTVDETLGGVVGTVTDTVSDIVQPGITPIPGVQTPDVQTPTIPPLVPDLPGVPLTVEPTDATVVVPVPAAAAPHGGLSGLDGFAAVPLLSTADSAVFSSSSTPSDARGGPFSVGGLCPSAASSSGPGGMGSGAWALVALGPLVALRAWVRRAGPEDENAPPAPAGSTDVSPD